MRVSSYCLAITVFAYVLIVSGGDLSALAGAPLSGSDSAGAERGVSASVIFAATETCKTQGEISEDNSGVRGQEQARPEKKEEPTPEAPDEVQKLKLQVIDVQNKGKLGFRRIVPCRSVEGFGAYSPLEPGEQGPRLVFYCEPSNVSTMVSEGRYVIDCSVDAVLMDSAGKVALARQSVVKLNRVSRSPVMDLYFKIELNLQKLAGRTVLVKIVLNDKIKNQSVSTLQKVNVEGGRKKSLEGI